MFDSVNRLYHLYIPFDAKTVFMAVLWLSLLIVVFHFFRKRTKLIQNFGIVTLVIMLVFMLVRIFVPLNFPFTQYISSTLYGKIVYFTTEYQLFSIPGTGISVSLSHLLLLVWLVGIAVSLLIFCVRVRLTLKALRKNISPPSEKETAVLEQVQKEFGKCGRLKLYRAMVTSPLTFGYFCPTILIPQGGIYNDEELYCVFLHELTHHRHKDAWIKLLVQILCSLFWWNPLVYVFQKDVDQILELHCDAAVCAKLSSEKQCDYLSAIVNTIHFSKKAQNPRRQQAATTSELTWDGKKERVQQRLQILLNISESPRHTKRYYLLICLLMCVVLFLSYFVSLQPSFTQYSTLEESTGVVVTQENSYLVEYPENCYFLAVEGQEDSQYALQILMPLEDSALVEQALNERGLEVVSVDKEGFLEVLALSGSQNPESDYLFWAYMYFPDLLTQEEREAFSFLDYSDSAF